MAWGGAMTRLRMAAIPFAKMDEIDRLSSILAILALAAVAYIYGLQLNTPPIRSDGAGYQAYLPALFIDHDLTFKTYVGRAVGGKLPGIRLYAATGNYLDKYPIGTALLQGPFFLVADGMTILFGWNRSGVSLPYQVANVVSGIFYFLLGVRLIYRTLRDHFEKEIALLTIWLVTFGTNVFHYATYDASFSHVYSFALIALFVRLSLRYNAKPAADIAALAGATLGLIIITRVNNGVVALVALGAWIGAAIAGLWRAAIWRDAAIFALCAAVAVSPQLLYWHVATGHFLIYSYGDEWFDFTKPHVVDFLFSIQKGLFFWSPALLICLIGFFAMPRTLRVFGAWAAVCMAVHVYVCSSWYDWLFGSGYGSRPFVDMMGILALPMAAGLSLIVAHSSIVVARSIAGLLIALNLVLMNGYWIKVVPFDGPTADELLDIPQKYFAVLSRPFRH